MFAYEVESVSSILTWLIMMTLSGKVYVNFVKITSIVLKSEFFQKNRVYIYTVVFCRGILQELLDCDRVTMIGLLGQDVFEVLLPCRNRK
jgi:hypothetical protein